MRGVYWDEPPETIDTVEKTFKFKNKDDLINAVYSRGYDEYIERRFKRFAEEHFNNKKK